MGVSILPEVPECVQEVVKEAAKPSAHELGTLFSDLLYIKAANIHLSADKKRAEHEYKLAQFKKELIDTVEAKPPERLVEPKMQVIGPSLNQAKYCLDEPLIREMFKNLIANAADTKYQSCVHPSFSAIIMQLSPLDAENLILFKESSTQPIVQYRYKRGQGYVTAATNWFMSNPKMKSDEEMQLQMNSIASLCRQGLVEVSYDHFLTDESQYEQFNETSIIKLMKKEVSQVPPDGLKFPRDERLVHGAEFKKGLATLTPLGKSFIEVCFES